MKSTKKWKVALGGAPRAKYYRHNGNLGVFEAAGTQNAFWGWKVWFSLNSTNFHENRWNSPKNAIFTTLHHAGGKSHENGTAYLIWLPFKAQNISRNWHSRNPLRRESAVSRPEMVFRAKSVLRGKVWFSRKCWISRKRWFRARNPPIRSGNS